MRVVDLPVAEQPDELLKTGVPESANEDLLSARGGLLVRDAATEEPLTLVLPYAGDAGALRRACLDYPMDTVLRAAGTRNIANNIGFTARQEMMQRYACRPCAAATNAPDAHATILDAGRTAAAQLREVLPTVADANEREATAILPEWRLPGTTWTSGVLNKNSALQYHYDRNNLPTWNAMFVIRRGITGGHFHIPSIGHAVECVDSYVFFMPAYRVVHGVTPMRRDGRDAYRFTAVLFTSARMADCGPEAEELARGRARRTEAEDHLLDHQREIGLLTT